MSSEMINLVFPDGTTEYRSNAQAPVVGDVFRHLGEAFVVVTVNTDDAGMRIVTLRRPEPSSAVS